MDLPLNVEVRGTDGVCGRSTTIILNPLTRRTTHLVVQEKGLLGQQHLVPLDLIGHCTPNLIRLRCKKADFVKLKPFREVQFVEPDDYWLDDYLALQAEEDTYRLWPYVYPEGQQVPIEVTRIPAHELAIHRGAKVQASDGKVGQVDEFLINRGDGHITHLILREGHFWRQRHVTIPVSDIERIEENRVFLKLSSEAIGKLPHIPIHRPIKA